MIFCTLFDSNYLDKAIVMIESILKYNDNFKMYVLPMDEKCKEVLSEEMIQNVKIIDHNDFLDKENLIEIKNNRSLVEFYYTCTPHLIEYVIQEKEENICTYIDSDLLFYSDPSVIVDEMGEKDVQIIKHGFSNSLIDKEKEKLSGKYCVEFNTFKNTKRSLELLNWWKEKCREYCGYHNNNFGDQKYLDEWSNNKFVSVVENPGAGLAPWNINQYKLVSATNNKILIRKNCFNNSFLLVFYHFENIQYIDFNTANINVYKLFYKTDRNLVNYLYDDYLKKTCIKKDYLMKKYGVSCLIKSHLASTTKNKSLLSMLKNKTFVGIIIMFRNILLRILKSKQDIFHISTN